MTTDDTITQQERIAQLDARIAELNQKRHALRNIPGHAALKPDIDAQLSLVTSLRAALEPLPAKRPA